MVELTLVKPGKLHTLESYVFAEAGLSGFLAFSSFRIEKSFRPFSSSRGPPNPNSHTDLTDEAKPHKPFSPKLSSPRSRCLFIVFLLGGALGGLFVGPWEVSWKASVL